MTKNIALRVMCSWFAISMPSIAVSETVEAKLPVVRLASLVWEPYVGPNLPEQGYAAEVARAAFAKSGYQLKIEFYPWARALMLSRSGKVDGVFPEYWGEEREKEFQFSDGFPGGPVGFYKHKKTPANYLYDPLKEPKKTLLGLQKYRFGVVRGYLNTPEFDAMTTLKKDSAVSDEMNLRKLHWGRVDLIFIDRNVAEHILRTRLTKMVGDLEFMQPAMANRPLYVAFGRESSKYLVYKKAFDEGLAMLRQTGELERIRKRHKLQH